MQLALVSLFSTCSCAGGAAMAHTILGVDFNADMGTIKFVWCQPSFRVR
jgi:hypothetical protein